MLVDLGGGTLPHPRADYVIDLHHPKNSYAQNAAKTPWAVDGGWVGSMQHLEVGWTDWKTRVIERNIDHRTSERLHILCDETIDEVYASHFMEHVHRGTPQIAVMNEVWRVLKPGGTFMMILPLVGYTDPHDGSPKSNQIGWQPWADPTHVNYWWFPEALMYHCEGPFAPHADYGMSKFAPMGGWIPEDEASKIISEHHSKQTSPPSFWSVRSQWEGVAVLRKP